MDVIVVSEYSLMFVGIIFYALCIIFFITGKIRNVGGKTTISSGKFNFSSNSFVVLSILSALFAFSPLVYSWLLVSKAQASPKVDVVTKDKEIQYHIRGTAQNSMNMPVCNAVICANQIRNDSVASSKRDTTKQMGEYEFVFDHVRLNDRIEVRWEDPVGNTIRRRFSPENADFNITFTN